MGFWSSITGSSGIKKARKASDKAYKNAKNFTLQGQAEADKLLMPGSNYQPAQGTLEKLLGLQGAQAQEDAYGDYRESPGVAWARGQGEESAMRGAAAGGQLASGRTLADLNAYGQGVAEQGFGDFYNRLRDLYGTKLGVAGNLAGMKTNTYNNLANLALGKGQARAGYAMQKGAIIPNLISQGSQILGGIAGSALGGGFGTAMGNSLFGGGASPAAVGMMSGGSSYGTPSMSNVNPFTKMFGGGV